VTDPVLQPGGSAPFNMTILGEALVRRMTEIFADFRLPNDNPDVVVPANWNDPAADPAPVIPTMFESVTVYVGSIKSRARGADGKEVEAKFPLVLVKPRACTDDSAVDVDGAQRSLVQVDFMIGTRRIGNDGYLDVTAMVERIRTNLLRDPVIENRARMELPLDIEIGDDESFPQWFGVVSARFNIPQPVEEIANE